MHLVLEAAEGILFYGVGAIQGRVAAPRPRHRFSALLLQSACVWHQKHSRTLEDAAASIPDCEVDMRIEQHNKLSPAYASDPPNRTFPVSTMRAAVMPK
jgi:LacI family transcriptional regulator